MWCLLQLPRAPEEIRDRGENPHADARPIHVWRGAFGQGYRSRTENEFKFGLLAGKRIVLILPDSISSRNDDGLGAIFGIVSGVSGATLGNSKVVVLAGVVGMIASALSMGSGAFSLPKASGKSTRQSTRASAKPSNTTNPRRGKFYRSATKSAGYPRKMPTVLSTSLPRQNATRPGTKSSRNGGGPGFAEALFRGAQTALGAVIPIVPFFFLTATPRSLWPPWFPSWHISV
jgi:hypothetical protein